MSDYSSCWIVSHTMLVVGSFSPRLWCFCVLWSWVNALTILVQCPFPRKSLITVSLSTGVLTEVLIWETRQRFAIVFPYESFANQFLSICRPDRSRIISPFDWQPFSFSHDAGNLIMDGLCVRMRGSACVCVCVCVCVWVCSFVDIKKKIQSLNSIFLSVFAGRFPLKSIYWGGWAVISCPL